MKTDPTILALRAADPARDEASAAHDPADLLARITAGPGDPRLQGRAGRRAPRRRLTIALALLALAALASTAFAVVRLIGPKAVEPPVTRAEYRAAQRQLTLPPGARWPVLRVPADSVTGPGAGGGRAVVIAQSAWECYWVKAIRSGDRAGQRRARTALADLLDHHMIQAPPGAPEDWLPPHPPRAPYAIFAADGGLPRIRATYRLAAAGHPARLAQSCRANAPG